MARQKVHPAITARHIIQRYLAGNAEALRRADEHARHDEPDAVHQMRVSLRRLRSALRSFRPLLVRRWADALRDELAWLSGELGPFRESEVLAARCADHSEPGTAPARLLLDDALRDRLDNGRTATAAALASDRYAALRETLDDACGDPETNEAADQPAGEALPPCVAREWAVLRRRAGAVLDAERTVPAPDADWHAARIAAKRARYAVDAVAPAIDGPAATLARRMSAVTDVLGEHQDAAQTAELAANLAAGQMPGSEEDVFSLGVVNGIERNRVTMARDEFAKLWPDVDTPELTGWFAR